MCVCVWPVIPNRSMENMTELRKKVTHRDVHNWIYTMHDKVGGKAMELMDSTSGKKLKHEDLMHHTSLLDGYIYI